MKPRRLFRAGAIGLLPACVVWMMVLGGAAAQGADTQQPGYVGLSVEMSDSAAVVADVAPGSPAADAGVRVGDVLIEVDGVARSGDDAVEHLHGVAGTEVKLAVERDGQRVDFTLTRAAMNVNEPRNVPVPQEGGGAAAGVQGYTVTPNTAAILIMPELKHAPAPGWVKPGMRITSAGLDGVTSSTGSLATPDAQGHFKLPNGENVSAEDFIGGAGRGITQFDIVAVHDDAVAFNMRTSVFNGVAGILTMAGEQGFTTTPGDPGGLWINPEVLQKYSDVHGDHVMSSQLRYSAAGQTFDALWVQTRTDHASTATVYDMASGLLLHLSSCSTEATTTLTNRLGQSVDTGGRTYASNDSLAGSRQVKAPWTQGKLPSALDHVAELAFDGTQTTRGLPGAIPMAPSTVHVTLKIMGRGVDFVQVHRAGAVTVNGGPIPFESDFVSGPAQLMPIAIDPADLAKLEQGQELDTDPVTQAVTKVAFVGRDAHGRDVVTLSEAIPGPNQQEIDEMYDRQSGLMIDSAISNPLLQQVTQVWLTSTVP